MKRMLWAIAITAVVVNGCTAARRDGNWHIRKHDFGEVLGDWIGGAGSDLDQSRRFWDQTSDNPWR
jgi:hypothetical protein